MRNKVAWLEAATSGAQAMRAEGWLVGVAGEDTVSDFAKRVPELTKV
jgi:hypothetical protein